MRVHRLSFLVMIILFFSRVTAGLGQELLLQDSTVYIDGEASFFVKNNEYFNDFTEGVTHIGYYLHPRVSMPLFDRLLFSMGVYYRQFGSDVKRARVLPSFSLIHHFSRADRLILGNIESAEQHGLSEIFYREDRRFTHRMEYGLQYIHNSERWTTDLWLDWRQFIQYDDPFPEVFFVGNRSTFRLGTLGSTQIFLEDEFLISHAGGQIDTFQGQDRNTYNIALAIKGLHTLSEHTQVTVQLAWHKSTGYLLPLPRRSEKLQGEGVHGYASMKSKSWSFGVGYWKGSDYTSPIGEHLFLTNLDQQKSVYHKDRELAYVKMRYVPTESRRIECGASAYYDIGLKNLDYNVYLYYTIRPKISLNIKSKSWLN